MAFQPLFISGWKQLSAYACAKLALYFLTGNSFYLIFCFGCMSIVSDSCGILHLVLSYGSGG